MITATIRIYLRSDTGDIEDMEQDFTVEDFGGVLPAAGDLILDPGVFAGQDRSDPENRRMWSVLRRVFNPRDNGGAYIVLVVQERDVAVTETGLLPIG